MLAHTHRGADQPRLGVGIALVRHLLELLQEVGFGKIMERLWAVAGKAEIRPLVTATLSGDHRATDGHRGGLLLSAIERLLQTPEKL